MTVKSIFYNFDIILFVWLCLQNYGLRGGIGPSVCHLCLRNDENTQHFLVNCEISIYIWKEVCSLLKLHDIWVSPPIVDNLKSGFLVYPRHIMVLLFHSMGHLELQKQNFLTSLFLLMEITSFNFIFWS